MTFDPNADPESLAARAAELALEQTERFRSRMKRYPDTNTGELAVAFYSEPFEVGISNNIATMLCGYAVLKGYVTLEQASR